MRDSQVITGFVAARIQGATGAPSDGSASTFGVQEHSTQLARHSLLICAALALVGSLASFPEIAHGQMYGPAKYLLASSVVVELAVILRLLIFPRTRPEPVAVAVSVYFGVYLSAGCMVCLNDRQMAGYVMLFFLWFSPLLVFNKLVNQPAVAKILGRTILVVPLCIVVVSWVRLREVLPEQSLFLLINLVLSHTMLGVMLEPLTRYRAAYTLEKERVESMRAEAELVERTAFHDSLTNLPNRSALKRELGVLLKNLSEASIGLLVIDLDNFRTLNDALGHAVGDELLKQVANRLATTREAGETLLHLGADQFVLVLEHLAPDSKEAGRAAEAACAQIAATLNETFRVGEHECFTTASIGGSLSFPTATAEDLLRRADLALMRAKAIGRSCACHFVPEMEERVAARARLARDLRRALTNHEFTLAYQPQVNADGHLIGAEALIRWCDPQRGWVPPSDFIPLAEEAGMIVPIGKWVLEEACSQLARWSVTLHLDELTISVNVSVRQLVDSQFVSDVEKALLNSGLRAHRLKLEITESAVMERAEEGIARMLELRAKGIRFSLDDFGTGHSSLAYLKRLPLDQLKIDRSFVIGVLDSETDASIARTVILLAQSLRIEVLAEGVETEGQRAFLVTHGCHRFQGYFFSRPLTVLQFEEFVIRPADQTSLVNAL
ncbi:MAG: putative bifunctional diguanylate cyclase/phosphodiesterase [Janthinobacterium lividum]